MSAKQNDDWVAGSFHAEMARFGITPARLRRHAWRNFRISRARVEEALVGNPGHLGRWTNMNMLDWFEMIRTAWLTD